LEEANETSEIGFRLRRVSLGLDLQRQNKNRTLAGQLQQMPPPKRSTIAYTRQPDLAHFGNAMFAVKLAESQ